MKACCREAFDIDEAPKKKRSFWHIILRIFGKSAHRKSALG